MFGGPSVWSFYAERAMAAMLRTPDQHGYLPGDEAVVKRAARMATAIRVVWPPKVAG